MLQVNDLQRVWEKFDNWYNTDWSTKYLFIFGMKSCFQQLVEALKIISDELDGIVAQKE